MDLRILDAQFDNAQPVSGYLSRIWNTKYSEHGDFQITTGATTQLARYLRSGAYIVDWDSGVGMFIESENTKVGQENAPESEFKGRSFESVLDRRIVWGAKTVEGNIQDIIRVLITESIISPVDPDRRIDRFAFRECSDLTGSDYNLTQPLELDGDNLYEVVKTLCAKFEVGFRILLTAQPNGFPVLTFELYRGRMRDGTEGEIVEFSIANNNLKDTSYNRDMQNYKSVALVSKTMEYSGISTYQLLLHEGIFPVAEQENVEGFYPLSLSVIATTDSLLPYSLESPRKIVVHFCKDIGSGATLNINDTGARPIFFKGSEIQNNLIKNGDTALFEYDGTNYVCLAIYPSSETLTERFDQVVTSGNITDSTGINRREIFVEASEPTDETKTVDEYQEYMREQGEEVLKESAVDVSMDAQGNPGGNHVFGQDYALGDIVLVDDGVGHRGSARVIEYIQSDDTNGPSEYPAFSILF